MPDVQRFAQPQRFAPSQRFRTPGRFSTAFVNRLYPFLSSIIPQPGQPYAPTYGTGIPSTTSTPTTPAPNPTATMRPPYQAQPPRPPQNSPPPYDPRQPPPGGWGEIEEPGASGWWIRPISPAGNPYPPGTQAYYMWFQQHRR